MIYELNVREYSWDPAGGFPEEVRGTYRAFGVEDTTLNGDGIHPTGMRYLQKLGVTHIQLMPVYDFGSVDETGPKEQFNWGYDPVNYWIPKGFIPLTRITGKCVSGNARKWYRICTGTDFV